MDKLENDNSSKRMMMAMGMSFVAYFVWIAMFAPEQMTNPPVQSLSEPATEQTESQSSNAESLQNQR